MIEFTKKGKVKIVYQKIEQWPVFSLAVYVNCGSRDEKKGLYGLAHFFEHMVFKGTENRTSAEISGEIEELGGELDAFTTRDLICFNCKLPSLYYKKGLDVVFDMLLNPLFEEKDISLEKKVVKEELRMSEENHEDSGDETFISLIYPEKELGRSILGNRESIDAFSKQNLQQYRESLITEENLIISAAGPVEFAEFYQAMEKYLDKLKKSGCTPSLEKQSFAVFEKRVKREGMEGVNFYCAFETFPANNKNRFALSIINNILGNGMSSRLFIKIREEMGLAYSVVSFPVYHRNEGMLYIYASTSSGKENEVKDAVLRECVNLSETMTKEEFEKGKSQLIGNLSMGLETSLSKALFNGKNVIVYGRPKEYAQMTEEVKKIEFETVKNLAKTLFKPEKAAILFYGNV